MPQGGHHQVPQNHLIPRHSACAGLDSNQRLTGYERSK
jgi:hypothetical protein